MSGRIRTIKPELLEDAVTAGLSDMAFRVFVASILLADDYGRLRFEPGWLRAQVYWAREVDLEAFAAAVRELRGKLVDAYEVNGQRYAEIRNWSKHQKVSHPGKPRIPPPPRPSGESRETLVPDLRSPTYDQDPERDARARGEQVADQVEPEPPSAPPTAPSTDVRPSRRLTAEPPPELGAPLPDEYRRVADGIAMNKFPDFDADTSWGNYIAWCVEQGSRPNHPRWWRWVSDDVERAKNRRLRASSGLRLVDAAPPVKAPYYAEWKPAEPDEELGADEAREASSGVLRALGVTT